MALGAARRPPIINYTARTLVGVLDWKLGLQQAIAAPNMGSRNRETEIELGSALEGIAAALRALGHPVEAVPTDQRPARDHAHAPGPGRRRRPPPGGRRAGGIARQAP